MIGCHPALVAFFRRRLPRGRAGEAEDLAHDTLIAAWVALARGGGDPVRDTVPYVLGIARNKCNRALRAGYGVKDVPLDPTETEGACSLAARDVADYRAVELEWREALAWALGRLAVLVRSFLYLRFFEGMDNEGACRRLGILPDVGSRIKYRALEKLRYLLGTPARSSKVVPVTARTSGREHSRR